MESICFLVRLGFNVLICEEMVFGTRISDFDIWEKDLVLGEQFFPLWSGVLVKTSYSMKLGRDTHFDTLKKIGYRPL